MRTLLWSLLVAAIVCANGALILAEREASYIAEVSR